MADIQIFQNLDKLVDKAAEHFIRVGNNAIERKGNFSVALSGGSTPIALYRLLVEAPQSYLNWSKVHFFWGDERCVPPDHPSSNYKMAYDTLLSHISTPASNIHRIMGELEPTLAAVNYQQVLESFFDDSPGFDLILLGMGNDGHTASLFPGVDTVFENKSWVKANFIPKLNTWRITLTPVMINRSDQALFIVTGDDKASTLREVLEGIYQPEIYPAQIIQPEKGTLTWMIDRGSARNLESGNS